MKKKGLAIASAVAAAIVLAGCSHEQQMPQGSAYQSGPSSKLGASHQCKSHRCKANHCKGNHCKGNG